MAHNISVNVKNKIATGDGTIIVCGNSDYVVNFTFDSEWANFTTKTMRIVYNDGYQEVVFNGNSCALPIISNALGVKIGVYAGNLETSTPAYFDCIKSIICGSGTHVTPPTDVYNQIIAMLNGFSANVIKAGATTTITIIDPQGTTVATVSDGAKGDKGDTGEKGDKGDTGAAATVVQTTGTSTDNVMSQNAVSDIYNKANKNMSRIIEMIFNKKVGFVDMGTLTWVRDSDDHNIFTTTSITDIIKGTINVMPNVINSEHETITSRNIGDGTPFAAYSKAITLTPNLKRVVVKDTSYTDAQAFKSAMSGIFIFYEKDVQ